MNLMRTPIPTLLLAALPGIAAAHPSQAGAAQHFFEHVLIAGLIAVPGFFLLRRFGQKPAPRRVPVRRQSRKSSRRN